jgi:hypothetical protein
MNRAASKILEGLKTAIAERLNNGSGWVCNGWQMDPEQFQATSLNVEDNVVHFTLLVVARRHDKTTGNPEEYLPLRLSFSLPSQHLFGPDPKSLTSVFVVETTQSAQVAVPGTLTLDAAVACLLPPQSGQPTLPSGLLLVPSALTSDITNFSQAKRGFPARIDGHFVRMLYLSAVTITTLGYGDIVPLTSAARLAVSFEAVMGVVVIGLFLNAIAKER